MAQDYKQSSKATRSKKVQHSKRWYPQYAAICLRRENYDPDPKVLLITSRGTGRWVIPKGNPMPGRKPHQVAVLEAKEEAGAIGKARKKPLGAYSYAKILDDGSTKPCMVDVVETTLSEYKEAGQRTLVWVYPCEAMKMVDEPELRALLYMLSTHS